MKLFKFNTGFLFSAVLILIFFSSFSPYTYQLARLKYNGGGDWYVSPTALPNLINFCNKNLGTSINPEEAIVEAGSPEIFNYPFIHMSGHGNVVFSLQETENLRNYLAGGGFLNINDSYGLDKFIRPQMKKVFPELDFIELPFSHPVYHQKYNFPNGLPKIHEHEGKSAQGFGLIYKGRLICYYAYESDIGDGWESPEVHKDPEEVRTKALQMGANIIQFVLLGK
jgi:hypothetical protein